MRFEKGLDKTAAKLMLDHVYLSLSLTLALTLLNQCVCLLSYAMSTELNDVSSSG